MTRWQFSLRALFVATTSVSLYMAALSGSLGDVTQTMAVLVLIVLTLAAIAVAVGTTVVLAFVAPWKLHDVLRQTITWVGRILRR